MAKLTALTAITAPTADDILYIVDEPGTAPVSRKITLANLLISKPSGTAGIKLDANAATGDFTQKLSPANLTADRRVTFPDRSFTVESGLIQTTVLTSGTSVTVSAKTNYIRLRMQAGGGGGGGADTAATNGAVGGGGAAGGYLEKFLGVTPSTAYTYAIGAAGAAGAAAAGLGGTGGDTEFTVGVLPMFSAKGGPGGVGMAAGTANLFALGGASPVVSTNGDVNSGGEPGRAALRLSASIACAGAGGSGVFGAGGNSRNTQGTGNTGVGFGAGGGGGCCLSAGAAAAGGPGLEGIIVMDEYT